jgi:hypothetical protein
MSIKHKYRVWEKTTVVIFVFALVTAMLSSVPKVLALGTITSASIWVVETNMDATGSGAFWFSFKSASSGSPSNITVTLGGTGVAFAASQTVNTTNCAGATGVFNFLNGGSGATALPGSPTASGSSNVLTIASAGSLTAGTQYCIGVTGSAVTNPSAAGIYSVAVADSLDSGSDYYPILASGTNEAITVGASVSQAFTLTLGGTTDTLGTLSTGSVISSAGVNATVSSNAAYGPTLFIYDTQSGLHSTNAGHLIASKSPNSATVQTIVTTTENYIANATYTGNTSGDTMTVAAPFAGTGGSGDGLSPYPSELAYATATSGPTNAAIVNIKESATITNITPEASDYSDTVYIVGTGTF